jgi:hypothetical protein
VKVSELFFVIENTQIIFFMKFSKLWFMVKKFTMEMNSRMCSSTLILKTLKLKVQRMPKLLLVKLIGKKEIT